MLALSAHLLKYEITRKEKNRKANTTYCRSSNTLGQKNHKDQKNKNLTCINLFSADENRSYCLLTIHQTVSY